MIGGDIVAYKPKYSQYRLMRSIKDVIEKRYGILSIIMIILFLILTVKLYSLQILSREFYVNKAIALSEKIVEGTSSPRGRIYDRNYNLLVDNKAVKTIYYKKPNRVRTEDEISLAYEVAKLIEIPWNGSNTNILKKFWLINNPDKGEAKITEKEWKLLRERKLTIDDIAKLKLDRITTEDLSTYNELDKEAAYIYNLMNQGYYYDEKIIKNENVTDEEYAVISENIHKLKGFNTKLDWERVYLYGDTLRTILGNVSSEKQGIPLELKNYSYLMAIVLMIE
jgi:cell division protein FtsI/penicillin-binding protein 2